MQRVGPSARSLLGLLFATCIITATSDDPLHCSDAADQYMEKHRREPAEYTGTNMVYFLHVPRTAGRTFHSCLLKTGTPPSRRCTKSYDHLRIDVAVPNCSLLSTHDDFSVVSLLPDGVSVLSQIRDPVDRVLSAYEFAVEVASRTMNRPANFKPKPDKMATSDVWPWSSLVPWFAHEIKERLHVREAEPTAGSWVFVRHPDGSEYYHNSHLKISKWDLSEEERQQLLPELDPYDNAMLPSLKSFVEHPVCHELLHNGAAFQVLGITNYSHWDDASALRRCVAQHKPTADVMLQVAQKRVARFVHVGITDALMESAESAAAALDYSLSGPAFFTGDDANGPGTKAAGARSAAASADVTAAARQLRKTRVSLQSAQKELAAALLEKEDEMTVLAPIRKRIAALRAALRDQQEALVAARSGGGVEPPEQAAEGDFEDDTVNSRDQDAWRRRRASRLLLHSAARPAHDRDEGSGVSDEDITAAESTVLGANGRHLLEGQMRDTATERRMGGTLGQEFVGCAARAHARNQQRKVNALAHITMPDGRGIAFSRQARARIPAEVIDYIRSANWMDVALHEQATQQLQAARAAQRKAGTLMDLPASPPAHPIHPKKAFPIPKPTRDMPDELRL